MQNLTNQPDDEDELFRIAVAGEEDEEVKAMMEWDVTVGDGLEDCQTFDLTGQRGGLRPDKGRG